MHLLRNVPSTTSTKSEFYYDRKPENLSKCQAIKKYLWNSEDRTVCNRTAKSWCVLLVFYLSFLFLCFGLCSGMIAVGVYFIDRLTNGTLYDVSEIKHPLDS